METSKQWAARVRRESDARRANPVLRAQDIIAFRAWLANLPHGQPQGGTLVVGIRRPK